MSELRHNLAINLTGNMERRTRRLSRAAEQMADRHGRSMRKMQSGMKKTDSLSRRMNKRVSRNAGRYGKVMAAGIIAGAAVAIKKIGTMDERVTQLLVDGNKAGKLSEEQLLEKRQEIKNKVADLKIKYGIDDSELFAAVERITEKTGDLDFAMDNLENFAVAIRATGAAGAALGGIAAELQKINIKDPDKVMSILNGLTAQGKMGAFTLKDMATYGEKIFASYQPKDETDIREMNAVMQAIRMGKGSSAEAASSFEALMRTFQNKENIKRFGEVSYMGADGKRHKGIDVYKKDSKGKHVKDRLGNKVLRDLPELLIDLVKKSKGSITNLSDVFKDSMALDAFKTLISKNAKGVDIRKFLIDGLQNADGNKMLQTDAEVMRETQSASGNKLSGVINKELDAQLSGFTQWINSFIAETDPVVMQRLMYATEAVTVSLATLAALGFLSRIPGVGKILKKIPSFGKGGPKPNVPKPKASGALRGYGAPKPVVKPSLIDKMSAGKSTVQGAQKPNIPKPNVPKPNVPKPNVPKPNVPKPPINIAKKAVNAVTKKSIVAKQAVKATATRTAAMAASNAGLLSKLLGGLGLLLHSTETGGGTDTLSPADFANAVEQKSLNQALARDTSQQAAAQAAKQAAEATAAGINKKPGRIDINVKASAGASATVSGVTNPTGQKLKIHNTVDSMRVGP